MKSFQIRFSTTVNKALVHCSMLLLALLALSCNEEKDEEAPLVLISAPFENQNFNTIDTLLVTFTATDNERVLSVDIEILDENFQPVGQKYTYLVSDNPLNFGTDFLLDKPQLESGIYYVVVRASDGSNQGSAYRKIWLNAIPLELEGIFVATASFNNVKVYSRPPDSSLWTEHLDRQVDFVGAALNYKQNIFGLAGGELGDAVFYETGEWQPLQTVDGPGFPSLPFFTGLSFSNDVDEFLLLLSEPRLRVYDAFAAGLIGFPLQVEHRPVSAYAIGDKYFVVEKPITNNNYSLATYARPGLLLSFLAVPGPVRGMFAKTPEEVFVWVDGTSGARLSILNTVTNLFSIIFERSGESLKSADRISQNEFVFSTSAGLFRYNFSTGATVVISNSVSPSVVKYESISGLLYTSSATLLQRYTLTGQFAGSESFNQNIRYFGFDYNR